MTGSSCFSDKLISLLGCCRTDDTLLDFLKENKLTPECTVDKQDGADYEYLEFKQQGFCLLFMSDKLESIFLYSRKKDPDYSRYRYPLPLGIHFEDSEAGIRSMLGAPDKMRKGNIFNTKHWIKYMREKYSMHIEFATNRKSIKFVTIELAGAGAEGSECQL